MAKEYDLIVIGAGPGGYSACLKARKLGMSAACVEKEARPGGVCLNAGCIPSKALLDSSEHYYSAREKFAHHGVICDDVRLDLKAMMSRKEKVVTDLTAQLSQLLKGNKVEMIQGKAKLAGANQVDVIADSGEKISLKAKNILLATGSEPIAVPGLAFDGQQIVSSTEALSFDAVPHHLCVIGGGFIGLELGSVWSRLGAKVTVVEMLPAIASVMDSLIIRGLERVLKKQGLEFRLNTKVTEAKIENGKVRVNLESRGESSTLECDKVLVAVGRRPLTAGLGLEDLGIETDARTGL
ncbi:MAG: FAD-dependent oxidoreductase [Desulfobacterales bacterium]